MAKEEKVKKGELCTITVDVVDNGYTICAYHKPEETLSQKAGWVPMPANDMCRAVAKTKADLLKQLKEIIEES